MGRVRTEVGFWAAVGRLRLSDLVTVEGFASVILGIGLTVLMGVFGTLPMRVDLAGTYVSVAAALVAIVFAGLALVASLLSETYLRLLRAGDSGILGFFRPFMLAIGIQVATIITAVVFNALGSRIPGTWELVAFGAVSVLFFSSCFEIVVLTRSVLMHALLRSRLGEVTDFEAERTRKRRAG